MAVNRVIGGIDQPVKHLAVACSHPTTPNSGDPVRFGDIAGVAQQDERADGKTTVDFGPTVYDLSVKGVDNSGVSGAEAGVAVSPGDTLYYNDSDTPVINKKTGGVKIGIALESVNSGATATIQVLVGRY